MVLKLKNNLDKKTYNFDVEDTESSGLYYAFNINLPENIADGEYSYSLYDNGELKAEGLLQIGDYKAEVKTYSKNKEFKQYKG